MKKRAKVVRLLHITNDAKAWGNILTSTFGKPHHLYFTTDDEIKEGDWFLNVKSGDIDKRAPKASGRFAMNSNRIYNDPRKIIATTDPELNLPQPSKEFIEEYCKVGGIDEVDIEYGLFHDGNFKDDDETHSFKAICKPIVTSNNEIIIHSIDDVDNELLKIKG